MKICETTIKNFDILSRKEAAVFMGVCRTTLDRLDIPKTKIRRRVMYKRAVLERWLDEHTETKSGERG
jgi:hypothetical protein